MRALFLVVALVVGAQAAGVSPAALERQSLEREMDARAGSLRPYERFPQVRAMYSELAALRSSVRRAPPSELGRVRGAFYDWQRRANAYLSGGGAYFAAPSHGVAAYRAAPRGYAAHPTRRQIEAFNRRHVRTSRVAKNVSLARGMFGSPSGPAAVRASRVPARPPQARLRPAPRRDRYSALPASLRREALPPPAPVLSERAAWTPSWNDGGPLKPLGEVIGGVGRGVGEVLDGGAHAATTIIGGLLSVPLAVFNGVTSGFGYRTPPRTVYGRGTHFHAGVDYRAAVGTPVEAGGDGVVSRTGWYGGYGKAIIIDHGGGVQSIYGHLSVIGVRPGQRVHRGMIIAKSGATGNVTGPHLHYEVRRNGVPFNPLGH